VAPPLAWRGGHRRRRRSSFYAPTSLEEGGAKVVVGPLKERGEGGDVAAGSGVGTHLGSGPFPFVRRPRFPRLLVVFGGRPRPCRWRLHHHLRLSSSSPVR